MVEEVAEAGVKSSVQAVPFQDFEDAVDVVEAPWSDPHTTVVLTMEAP